MNEQPLNVNIDQDKIDAKYCDQVMVNTTPFGMTFDFMQLIPQAKSARVLSRIAMSPQHAKMFSDILSGSIKRYEDQFGEIKLTSKMKDEAEKKIGFKS